MITHVFGCTFFYFIYSRYTHTLTFGNESLLSYPIPIQSNPIEVVRMCLSRDFWDPLDFFGAFCLRKGGNRYYDVHRFFIVIYFFDVHFFFPLHFPRRLLK